MNVIKTTLLLTGTALVISSCGSAESDSANDATNHEAEVIPTYDYTTTSKWVFDAESSSIDWSRILDQKATKKKVKLFGAMVDMDLGPVKLEMEGDVSLQEGYLNDKNGEYQDGNVVFDMATFKFAQEKGEGLFNTKEFPHSTLEFLSFTPSEDSTHNYTSKMKLTIQDHSEEFDVPVMMSNSDGGVNMKGEFSFNTLDYPLRDNAKKKEVNKDEITVNMDMNFTLGESMKDSVRTN